MHIGRMIIHSYLLQYGTNVKNDKQKILSETYHTKCALLISFSA